MSSFPLQGNIGEYIRNEADNFSGCSKKDLIGGAPNCTGKTYKGTKCKNCTVKEPEIYGIQTEYDIPKCKLKAQYGFNNMHNNTCYNDDWNLQLDSCKKLIMNKGQQIAMGRN